MQPCRDSFDSLNVRFVGNWPFGFPEAVVCNNTPNIVFLGSGGGVYVMDVNDPAQPIKINEAIRTRGLALDLICEDSLLYIACGYAGFEIWNVCDINNPVQLCWYQTSGNVTDIDILDTIACISNSYHVTLLSVADPVNPFELGSCLTNAHVRNVAINSNYAFISNESDTGIHVLDITDPSNPYEIGSYNAYGHTYQIDIVADTLAYVGAGTFEVYNFADPSNPHEVTHFHPFYSIQKFELCNAIMYVAAGWDGFAVVSVTDPLNPQTIGSCALPWLSLGVAVSDSAAYIANRYNALLVLDISNPTTPVPTGRYNTPSSARDVVVSNDLAHTGQLRAGLYILDISNPSFPYEVGRCDTSVTIREAAVDGDYVYAACLEDTGLMVFNVTDPTLPYVTDFAPMNYPCGIDKEGDYAFIANEHDLAIYDVSDPYDIYLIGSCNVPWNARGVDVVDTIAYLANGSFGLRIINVANPSSPYEIGLLDTPGIPWRVTSAGNYAYVADGSAGLRIIDVSVPSAPFEVGFYDTPGTANEVTVAGNLAYVADGGSGVRIINVADPANPYEVGYYTAPYAASVDILGDYIYIAGWNYGIQIYESMVGVEESTSSIIKIHNIGSTIFHGPLHLPKGITCRVFDITGRIIEPTMIRPGIYFIEVDGEVIQKVIKVK